MRVLPFRIPKWHAVGIALFLPALANDVPSRNVQFSRGALLYEDNFDRGLLDWSLEIEQPGSIEARAGVLNVAVPAGATVWFKHKLSGPVLIEYEARVIQAGGPHDRLSDLNCFWMANDQRSPSDLFATSRSGRFADYNQLKTYYVGQGGNGNTTTRFRRYIGEQDARPLLRGYDLSAARFLLKPNLLQTIQLIAAGERIQYLRDGELIFDFNDHDPYTAGYFAFRTTHSHIQFQHFRVYRLEEKRNR
jgi:hypothetical protein